MPGVVHTNARVTELRRAGALIIESGIGRLEARAVILAVPGYVAGSLLRAFDTTCAIPRFNNSGTQNTVLLLQNPTSRPVTIVASFWSEAGALLATHAPPSIPAHGLLVLDTATLPQLAGASGSITIANDAPYGTLAGKAVSLEPSTGFSFDSVMNVRAR